MATLQPIDLGTAANDGTGDTLRAGGDKINDNFAALNTEVAAATSAIADLGDLAAQDTVGTGDFDAGAIVNADINAAAAIALSKLATDPLARANHTGTQALSTISDAGDLAALDTVDTAQIADNAVTLAKMAHGTARALVGYDGDGVPAEVTRAVQAEAEAGTADDKWMTPLKVSQAITALALAAVKAADGSGSGLDADLLDGNEAAAFATAAQGATADAAVQPADLVADDANNDFTVPPPMWTGTETEYTALTPSSGTLYFVKADA